MVRKVLQVGDPILRKKCEKVTRFDEELDGLLDDLKDTVLKEEGAGLAAPQIGVSLRVFVVNVDEVILNSSIPYSSGRRANRRGRKGVSPSAARRAPSSAPRR